jgi:NADH dehydrogenase
MKDVLVLGGGFAGVWSAAGAVRLARSVGDDELHLRLISNCIDLGSAGALMTDRVVDKDGTEAKAMKQAINTQWIYPPADSAEALLAKAGHFSNSA